MNSIVYFPNIDFDYDYLKHLVVTSKEVPGRPKHHRLVSDDPYMTSIREKYWFLSSIYNVYRIKGLPLHVDAGRQCTLNIPLENTEKSITIVYEPFESNSIYNERGVLYELTPITDLKEIYRFTLTKPTLFNTSLPHEVRCYGYERISISWTISKEFSFEQACSMFEDVE